MPLTDEMERQRAQRLTDQQIATRNPGASKIRGYDWDAHSKRSKQIQKTRKRGIKALLSVLPGRWRGVTTGLLFSTPWSLVGVLLLPAEFDVLALIPMLLCAIG
ncbi:MAG: hypothetical protein SGI73_05700, partial [Chloroflexota bacterium]|nr:hypothetical protein [Chloroflexota bacterium]